MTDPYQQYPSGQFPGHQPPPGYGPYPPGYGPGYGYGPQMPPPPDNNLVWGILTTLMCCLPLGIVSIVKANQVNNLWMQGRHAEAHKAADEAKKWAMWSAIAAAGLFALYILVWVVLFLIWGVSIGFLGVAAS